MLGNGPCPSGNPNHPWMACPSDDAKVTDLQEWPGGTSVAAATTTRFCEPVSPSRAITCDGCVAFSHCVKITPSGAKNTFPKVPDGWCSGTSALLFRSY